MAKKTDKTLRRLENLLLSAEEGQNIDTPAKDYKIYNSDKADLDLEEYSQAVLTPKKGSFVKKLIAVLVLAVLAAAAYWLYCNGGLPGWN